MNGWLFGLCNLDLEGGKGLAIIYLQQFHFFLFFFDSGRFWAILLPPPPPLKKIYKHTHLFRLRFLSNWKPINKYFIFYCLLSSIILLSIFPQVAEKKKVSQNEKKINYSLLQPWPSNHTQSFHVRQLFECSLAIGETARHPAKGQNQFTGPTQPNHHHSPYSNNAATPQLHINHWAFFTCQVLRSCLRLINTEPKVQHFYDTHRELLIYCSEVCVVIKRLFGWFIHKPQMRKQNCVK